MTLTDHDGPEPLLVVRDLEVAYPAPGFRGPAHRVLEGVSLSVAAGRTLGVVGESGSGKSTLGRAILGLAPVAAGSIRFDGTDLLALDARSRRRRARDIQVVFQDPYSSLNPAMTIEEILVEPLVATGSPVVEARARVASLLGAVQLPADAGSRLPREFSGGQRQRIAIARALACEPKLIVCDEPTSALDLSTQEAVLQLLIDLQRQTEVAYLFISHDLAVVRHISHTVAVLRGGSIVESGDGDEVTRDPQHEYTKRLFLSAPVPDPVLQAERRAARLALRGAEAVAG